MERLARGQGGGQACPAEGRRNLPERLHRARRRRRRAEAAQSLTKPTHAVRDTASIRGDVQRLPIRSGRFFIHCRYQGVNPAPSMNEYSIRKHIIVQLLDCRGRAIYLLKSSSGGNEIQQMFSALANRRCTMITK